MMTTDIEELVNETEPQRSSIADMAVWDALPYEDKQALARVIKDHIADSEETFQEGYDEGFANGKKEGISIGLQQRITGLENLISSVRAFLDKLETSVVIVDSNSE